jgi:hypothetical protein
MITTSARLPRSSVPMLVGEAEDLRAADGAEAEHFACADRLRIAAHHLLQARRAGHLLEHVEVVVRAGRTVGAEADFHPGRRSSRRPAQRRRRASDSTPDNARRRSSSPRRCLHLVGGEMHAVRGDDVIAEEADRVEIGAGRHPVLLFRDLRQLVLRFRDVDEDRAPSSVASARTCCRCSFETVNGACGASAGVIRRSPFHCFAYARMYAMASGPTSCCRAPENR